jgi:hypothetical protein
MRLQNLAFIILNETQKIRIKPLPIAYSLLPTPAIRLFQQALFDDMRKNSRSRLKNIIVNDDFS